eukprot:1015863-Rhodomonas_salina.2
MRVKIESDDEAAAPGDLVRSSDRERALTNGGSHFIISFFCTVPSPAAHSTAILASVLRQQTNQAIFLAPSQSHAPLRSHPSPTGTRAADATTSTRPRECSLSLVRSCPLHAQHDSTAHPATRSLTPPLVLTLPYMLQKKSHTGTNPAVCCYQRTQTSGPCLTLLAPDPALPSARGPLQTPEKL